MRSFYTRGLPDAGKAASGFFEERWEKKNMAGKICEKALAIMEKMVHNIH